VSQFTRVVDNLSEGLVRLWGTARERGLLPGLIIALLLIPILIQRSAFAQASRVVTIHVDEETASFPTGAVTVEEALDTAGIAIGQHDLVEPAKETAIITDTFNINVFRARPVLVIDGDKRIETVSPYQSPKLIAEQAGLTIYPEDTFVLERIDDFVGESALGLKLTVVRATKLKLNLYGTTKSIRTQASTVGELLDQHGLDPSAEDIVRPKTDSKIKSNMTVYLVRVSGDTVVKEETIPFDVREIRDKSKPLGYEDIQKAGRNGSKLVTYKVTFENGEEASRKVLSSVTVEQPVEQVVVVGDKYDLAEAFAQLRQCEATSNYQAVDPTGTYYGAYQFSVSTWNGYVSAQWQNVLPNQAPSSVQDLAALKLYQARGWQPWPACTQKLGLR